MRKNAFIVLVLLCVSVVCSAQLPSYVPSNGIVGWWPFSGNANDHSGQGNGGNVLGPTLSPDRFATPNSSYYFNGINAYIQVNDAPELDLTTQYSFSVWVKLADYSLNAGPAPQRTILSKQRIANGIGYSLRALDASPNQLKYSFHGQNNVQTQTLPSVDTLGAGNWHHIVYTYDGAVGKMFKNGNLVSSSNFAITLLQLNKVLFFGREFDDIGQGGWFKGNLDDIGIWNRALTPCEILNLYNSGIVTASAMPATICAGASTVLTGGGAVSYTWNPGALVGSPTVAPATTTTYTVIGTTANGCTASATVVVNVNQLPLVTATASPAVLCLGSSATLTGGGAVSYSWNPGALVGNPTVTPNVTTTFTVSGTDANGCVGITTTTVTVINLPNVTATATPSTICEGASTSLTGGGAVTYSWNPGALVGNPTVSPTTTTTYTVEGSDVNGCTGSSVVMVTVNSLPVVSASVTPDTVCQGSPAVLTGGGAMTYTWNPGALVGNPTVTPIVSTTYTVNGTDVNGCSGTATTILTVNPNPIVTATASPTTLCAGASSNLTAGGAATYIWNPGALPGNPTVNPVVTTTYTVSGFDGNGCSATATATIMVNPTPTVSASASPAIICVGATSVLSGSGAVTYLWNPGGLVGSPTVNPIVTTSYTVTGTDNSGCTGTSVTVITVNPNPIVTASASPANICLGDTSALTGGGAGTYLWNPGAMVGSPTVTPLVTTTYTLTGTDGLGCSATSVATVTVNPIPIVNAMALPTLICSGDTSLLTGTGAVSYLWNPGAMLGAPLVTPGITTIYTLTGTDGNGCTATSYATVTVNQSPIVTSSASPSSLCDGAGTSSVLSASGAVSYNWDPGALVGSPTVSPATTTTYTVTGTAANGCTGTSLVTINVYPYPTITSDPADDTTFIGSSAQFVVLSATPGVSYQWQTDMGVGFSNLLNVGQYSGATDDTLMVVNATIANNNQPFRCIVSLGTCTDTSKVAILTTKVNNVGVIEVSENPLLTVYPNPALSEIIIKVDASYLNTEYSMSDCTGKMLLSGKLTAANTVVNLGNISAGFYLVCVGAKNKRTIKLIKN